MRINFIFIFLLIFAAISVEAQSTNVEFPTPVTTDTISGKIKARDIGDSRSTIYYYVFEGTQGDIFLKIEAANLNGDIDIFYAENLRPLTKISLYADSSPTQTGREIYLRKPEKLILKVEGRTPNDDPATFSIKFEGSFKTMAATKNTVEPKIPEVKTVTTTEPEVKVNSVGTIIEFKPKPTPTPKTTVAKITKPKNTKTTTNTETVSTVKTPKSAPKKTTPKKEVQNEPEKKTELIITESVPKTEEVEKVELPDTSDPVKGSETVKVAEKPKSTKKNTVKKTPTAKKATPVKKETTPAANKPTAAEELAKALENVKLVVDFKDGARIERPMNDVLKFGVEKGYLTIINKDGSIGRYSILEITKISVE